MVVLYKVLIGDVSDILVSKERFESVDNTDVILVGLLTSASIDISLKLFGDVISDVGEPFSIDVDVV